MERERNLPFHLMLQFSLETCLDESQIVAHFTVQVNESGCELSFVDIDDQWAVEL